MFLWKPTQVDNLFSWLYLLFQLNGYQFAIVLISHFPSTDFPHFFPFLKQTPLLTASRLYFTLLSVHFKPFFPFHFVYFFPFHFFYFFPFLFAYFLPKRIATILVLEHELMNKLVDLLLPVCFRSIPVPAGFQ